MRRGFKAWCENTVCEYRSALGLEISAPLDPSDLACHLGVMVWTPDEVPELSRRSLKQLTETDSASWSAATIAADGRHLIILNSAHTLTRQNNSLAHELAHIILNHRPADTQISQEGILFSDCYDKNQEDEADWFGASLLLPREGLRIAHRRISSATALAEHFGVSQQLVEWRLRMTGVLAQARRAKNKYGR